jgi:hypothetical protein
MGGIILNSDLIEYHWELSNFMMPIPLGSSVSYLKKK